MSELYASMLMVGVTVTLGSVLVASALGTMGQAQGALSLGGSLQQARAGRELSLAFVAVTPAGSCPAYRGVNEGTAITIALFDYGAEPFVPAALAVNSTIYPGGYAGVPQGGLAQYTVRLGSCAHPTGQTVTAVDAEGDEVQLGS